MVCCLRDLKYTNNNNVFLSNNNRADFNELHRRSEKVSDESIFSDSNFRHSPSHQSTSDCDGSGLVAQYFGLIDYYCVSRLMYRYIHFLSLCPWNSQVIDDNTSGFNWIKKHSFSWYWRKFSVNMVQNQAWNILFDIFFSSHRFSYIDCELTGWHSGLLKQSLQIQRRADKMQKFGVILSTQHKPWQANAWVVDIYHLSATGHHTNSYSVRRIKYDAPYGRSQSKAIRHTIRFYWSFVQNIIVANYKGHQNQKCKTTEYGFRCIW